MKTLLSKVVLACGLVVAALPAAAQYPNKPVHLIVPFPAGGASDAAARIVGQGLSKSIGQPVVVENRPGANGTIAAQAVLNAPADGYTLLWASASMIALPMLQKAKSFDTFTDFAPVSSVGRLTFGLFVHPGVPAKNVAELIAYARANPDKLSYAVGTLSEYMAAAQFMKATGTSMVRVPYKGGAQAMPDLVAGRVQVYFTPISLALPHAKENKLRMLATLLPQRSAAAPDIATIAEAGVPAVAVPTWQAIVAPPKTPREVVDRLYRGIGAALQNPESRTQLEQQTLLIDGTTPEALAAGIKDDLQTWTQFVRDNDIKPE